MTVSVSKSTLAIIFITIAGAVLRLITITKDSFWFDEGATVSFAAKSFVDIGNVVSSGEFNPPLFYWLEHITYAFAGPAEAPMRIIPAIAGILTIVAIYYLGKEIENERLGIFAAVLLAFSPWHILYSQEARGYTLTVLFFVCAMIYFIRFTKQKSGFNPLLFGIFGSLCIWTHLFSALFVAPMIVIGIVYILKRRDVCDVGGCMVCDIFKLCIPVVMSFPLIAPAYTIFGKYTESAESMTVAAAHGLSGVGIVGSTLFDLTGFMYAILTVVVVSIPIGLYYLFNKDRIVTITLASLIAFPFIVALSLSGRIVLDTRYFAPMLPVLFILVAAFLMLIADNSKTMIFSAAILAFVITMCVPQLIYIGMVPQKPEWRPAAEFVSQQNVSDVVIISGHYSWHPFRIYYTENNTRSAKTVGELENISPTGPMAYIVSPGEMEYMDMDGKMGTWLNTTANLTRTYVGVNVYIKE